ncbi:MAG: HD-GYP domain-containing protein [Deltaproteobacteria bacterium]|nr:HD-GYP domain-containing protein [Deltaproteobacteria bacterium]
MDGFYNYSAIILERKAKLEMLGVIAKTLGLKNPYTEKHSENMINLAVSIGRKIGLSSEKLETIRYGTLLHDIGKLAVSDNILNKEGKLTSEEFDEIKKHPITGYDLLHSVFEPIALIIRHHHEKIDGSGYPDGLKKDEISIEAKIVAVVDVYDALTNVRPYKKAFSKKEALKIIMDEECSHFDKKIAECLVEIA